MRAMGRFGDCSRGLFGGFRELINDNSFELELFSKVDWLPGPGRSESLSTRRDRDLIPLITLNNVFVF